eukprot:scpid8180/ scgid15731/ Phosphatidylinositol 3,4,5-trisphosphate-dependent Rac exchanger 2 protein; DEP domain-containing protein 2
MESSQVTISEDGSGDVTISIAVPNAPKAEVQEQAPSESPTPSGPVVDVSEKDRRLRHFVVKEIVETERSYLSTLDVVCKTMKQGMLDGMDDEPEFTEEVVNSLFSNVDDLRTVHMRIVDDLTENVSKDYDADSAIGAVYMKHTTALKENYTIYGSTHEKAQAMIVELIRREPFKSYFTNILSDRGQMASDANIQSYLLCPVQRICKYPLLFRELCKYTWNHHPDQESAKSAYQAMQVVCSVINEAKRRAEKLEAVHDWQQGIDNFEGANLVDTCNEMVLKGSLLKISSGNCQERWFFLFDGVLVYCKKTGEKARAPRRKQGGPGQTAQSLGFAFKGRIPLETMEVQNLEDGTSDQLTCGSKVTNAWRLQNVAKKKWFVCMASSEKEKQTWMETLLAEREKRRMVALNQMQETYLLLSAKARNYYKIMQENRVLKDRKVKKAVHHQSFLGSELIHMIMDSGESSAINQASDLALEFLAHTIIEKVEKKPNDPDKPETFENKELYIFKDKKSSQQEHGEFKAVHLYSRIHLLYNPIVRDNKALLSSIKSCFSGKDLIDFLIAHGDFSARGEAQQFGQHLFSMGFLQHVDDKHHFKDAELMYRFLFDNEKDTNKKKQEFFCSDSNCSRTVYMSGGKDIGITLEADDITTISAVTPGSEAAEQGVDAGMVIQRINYLQASKMSHDGLMEILHTPGIISLCVSCKESVVLRLVPDEKNGFGFKIVGSSPATVSEVSPDSSASRNGLFQRMAVASVGGQDVTQATHTSVHDLVRAASKQVPAGTRRPSAPAANDDELMDTEDLNFSEKTGGLQKSASVQSFVNMSAVMDSVTVLETPSDLCSDAMGPEEVQVEMQVPDVGYDTYYQYDTLGDAEVTVRETVSSGNFAYSVPARLFECLLTEDKDILSHVETVNRSLEDGQLTIPTSPQFEGSLSSFLEKMTAQVDIYQAMTKVLSAPRCRQHKGIFDNHRWELLAAPLNCNILEMEVCTSVPVQTNGTATPSTVTRDDEDGGRDDLQEVGRVFYHIVTAGAPSAVEVCRMEDPEKGAAGLKSLMEALGPASDYRKWFHQGLKMMDELFECQLQVRKAFEGPSGLVAPSKSFCDDLSDEEGLMKTCDSMSSLCSSATTDEQSDVNQAAIVAIGSFLSKADKFCETLREKSVNAAVAVIYSPSQRESTSTLLSGKVASSRPSQLKDSTPKRALSISSQMRSRTISGPTSIIASTKISSPSESPRERRNTIRSQRGGYLELAEAQTLTTINKLQAGKQNAGRKLIQQVTELKSINSKCPTEEGTMPLIDDILSGIKNINDEVCRCLLHAMIMEEDLGVVQRRDIVFAQALSIMMSGFSERLHAALNSVVNHANEWGSPTQQNSVQWLQQLPVCGLLVQFDVWAEAHLADEMAMLEDADVAIEDLRQIDLRIKCCPPEREVEVRRHGGIAISGRRGHITVEYFLDSEMYNKLPSAFYACPPIHVRACLFTSAMSDLATLTATNKLAGDGQALQCSINTRSVQYLKDYCTSYRTFLLDTSRTEMSRVEKMVEIDKSLSKLQAIDQALACLTRTVALNEDRDERYGSCSIILQANNIVNRCGGLRVACSEKGCNRVSLATSVEMASVLMQAHQLPPRSFIPAINVVRSQGSGISNLHKNKQGDKYVLLNVPPSLYRPHKSYYRLSGSVGNPMDAPKLNKKPQKSRSFFAKASMRLVGRDSSKRKGGINSLVLPTKS